MTARLQDVHEPDNVAFDVRTWIFDGIADAGLGGQVDDPIKCVGGEALVNTFLICEICANELVVAARTPSGFLQGPEPRLLERRVVIVVYDVEADYGITSIEEPPGHVKANEPCVSGYEKLHAPQNSSESSISEFTGQDRFHIVQHGFWFPKPANGFCPSIDKLPVRYRENHGIVSRLGRRP